jgi:hypothetical protein
VPSGDLFVVGLFDPCRSLDGVTTTPRTEPLTLLSLLVVPTRDGSLADRFETAKTVSTACP